MVVSDLVQYIRTLDNAQLVFIAVSNLAFSHFAKVLEIYGMPIQLFWIKLTKTMIR